MKGQADQQNINLMMMMVITRETEKKLAAALVIYEIESVLCNIHGM